MEIKKEIIQIETFFKYAEEGECKKLESIERLVRVDGEVVQRQQMSPLMYRLDNSPIQQFLSWVKGDGRRDKKLEDCWKEVRYSVDNRKGDSWISRPAKPLQLKMTIPSLRNVRVHEPSCKENKVESAGKFLTKSNGKPLLSEDIVWDDEIYMLDDAEEEEANQNHHTQYRSLPVLSETEKGLQILERMRQALEDGVSSLRELENQRLVRKLLQDQF